MKLYIKRKFAAAHYLPGHPKCEVTHGHTYLVELWLKGEIDTETGMVVDFDELKEIIDTCDHRLLNDVLPLEFLPPTAENLVKYFLDQISCACKVRVWESDNSFAEGWSDKKRLVESFVPEIYKYDTRF